MVGLRASACLGETLRSVKKPHEGVGGSPHQDTLSVHFCRSSCGHTRLLKPQRKQRADTQEINSGPRGAHEQIHMAVNIWGSARTSARRDGGVNTV